MRMISFVSWSRSWTWPIVLLLLAVSTRSSLLPAAAIVLSAMLLRCVTQGKECVSWGPSKERTGRLMTLPWW